MGLKPLDRLLSALEGLLAACLVLLVLLVFALMLLRYAAGLSWPALSELAQWLHASAFMLGLGLALRADRHVRIDVFSARWTARTRARVELAGTALLVLPFCGFLLWSSWDYVAASWSMREASAQGDGLPGLYLVKALIPMSAVLLALAALARLPALLFTRDPA